MGGRYSRPVLHGAIAAALTPLSGGGAVIDEAAFEPYVGFLAANGVDGLLALGTTGEGVLFDVDERKRVAELFLACRGQLQVAVHCGAQNTADTVLLAEHAAEAGADAVAVIGPPYFALDADELLGHFPRPRRHATRFPSTSTSSRREADMRCPFLSSLRCRMKRRTSWG